MEIKKNTRLSRNIEIIETSENHITLGKSDNFKKQKKTEEEVSLKIMLFSQEELERFQEIASRICREKSELRKKTAENKLFFFRFNNRNN